MPALRYNKILIGTLAAMLLFGLWNLTWYLLVQNRYQPFLDSIPKNPSGTYSIRKEDGYAYNVKLPDYLSFTGNLGVSSFEKGEALIIWPSITGGYRYGFRLEKEGTAYEIYVTDKLEPEDITDRQAAELVQKYRRELAGLFDKARGTWALE